MPDNNSYPFNTYSGILTPDHYKKIGNAIWLFLWCVSSTTAEKEKDGVVWGIVKGNQPQKYPELAKEFGVTERTVRSWAKTLDDNGYIRITRAPYGLVFSVKNSKRGFYKRVEDSFQSDKRDRKNSSYLSERTEESFQSGVEENFRSNKDIIKDLTTTITTKEDPVDIIAEKYTSLRTIQEGRQVYPTVKDYEAIAQIVARGMPLPQTIELLEQCFKDYEERRSNPHERIKAFGYCEKYITDHFEKLQAKEEAKKLAKRRIPEGGQAHKNNRRSAPVAKKQDESITGEQVGRIRKRNV